MTISWALLIIVGLYLVERHKLWRRTFQVAGVLVSLTALSLGAWIVWEHRAKVALKHNTLPQTQPRAEQPLAMT